MDEPTCSIDGCDSPVLVKMRGWCGAHHQKWLKYGDPLWAPAPKPTICAIEDCETGGKLRRGWCSLHYERWKAHGDPLWTPEARICSIDGCDAPHEARGWCRHHWRVWDAHGDPEWVRPPAPECAVETCDETAIARGWCNGHWRRWKETGDVRADVPLRRQARYAPGSECAVEDCTERPQKRGWCDTHYRRWQRTGDPLKVRVIHGDLWARVETQIDRSGGPDACWPWSGPKNGGGYGQTMVDGKLMLAHAFFWEAENGPRKPGIELDHECHNEAIRNGTCKAGECAHRLCCNPRHLVPRTRDEHAAASPGRQRRSKGVKLTEAQAREIYALMKDATTKEATEIASRFGISLYSAQSIRRGRTWGWLADPAA